MPKLPPAIVDSLDAVPEAQREFYAPLGDGRFRLDAEGVEDVRGLKSAHEAQKVETREAKKLAQQYAGLGLSAEEIRALVDEKKARDEKKLKDEGDFNSLRQQLLDQNKAEVDKREQRIGTLTKTIDRSLRESAATAAIAAHKASVKLLLPHVMDATRLVEDEATGEFAAVVVDAKGKTRYGTDGNPMTIPQLVDELKGKEEYAGAFPGSGASGSGASGSTTTAAGAADLSRLSPEARLAYARERGLK